MHDANSKPIDILSIISLFTQAETAVFKTQFLVCQHLSVPFMLVKNFINKSLGSIDIVRQRIFVLKRSSIPRCRSLSPIPALTEGNPSLTFLSNQPHDPSVIRTAINHKLSLTSNRGSPSTCIELGSFLLKKSQDWLLVVTWFLPKAWSMSEK